jgi:hypothetical protein
MPGTYFLVDPDGRYSYEHDWNPFLAKDNDGNIIETIDSRQWLIAPLNGTSPETPILSNDQSNVVFVEGFVAGRVYRLTEEIVTNNGVRDQQTIVLRAAHT